MTAPRRAHVAAALAVVALLVAPATASAGPGDGVVRTVGSVVVCHLVGVDNILINLLGPASGGDYPGRATLQVVIGLFRPDGTIGRPADDAAESLGSAWDNAFGTALAAVDNAERTSAAAVTLAAAKSRDGVQWAHDVKCWTAHGVLLPAWDHNVSPTGDCWAGGPAGQWLFAALQPPPHVPGAPPGCALPPGWIPPATLPPLPPL